MEIFIPTIIKSTVGGNMDYIINVIGIEILYKLGYTIVAIIGVSVLQQSIVKFLNKKVPDIQKYYKLKTNLNYAKYFLLAVILLIIWFDTGASLTTYLGLLSAGLAVALKDFIVNSVSWLFIVWRKPFEVGDRIQIGQIAGDVIDQRIFQFTLNEIGNWIDGDQSTGRIIHVPNSKILSDAMSNYTKGFPHLWNEIYIMVTFESNWEKAKAILLDIANKNTITITKDAEKQIKDAAKKYLIFYNNLTPIVYTSIEDSGVKLSIRHLCMPHQRRGTAEQITEDVLRAFAKEEDIDLAYNTVRFVSKHTTQEL